ncbi:MAG: metalloregulator ArsR/SmtB family transcription factor [Deltaproteobacteria bacterium]|nr:metalloregulator ArsR/SmtB family transcription factor [Deltaproteobacteria bacterium]
MSTDEILLTFFKSLADANRLRIVGLLAHRPHTVEELAEVVGLKASTISHHLSKLSKAGLVAATVQGHYHLYALDTDALEERARALLSTDELRELAPLDDAVDPYERKVLTTFLDADGRMKAHPMKRKKFEVLLRHALRTYFVDEGPWDEKEINRRLKPMTDDVASIRRGFIDHRLMSRDRHGKEYRRL